MNPKALQRKVERSLGCQVPENIWQYLSDKHYVSEAINDDHADPVDYLANEAKKLLSLAQQPELVRPMLPSRRQRRQERAPVRIEAISELLAAIARKDSRVRAFRQQFLSSGVLDATTAVEWIEKNRGSERYTCAIVVSVPKNCQLHWGVKGFQCTPSLSAVEDIQLEGQAPVMGLEFARPGDKWVHVVPVGRDGVLRKLHDISESLARIFDWQPAQATMFVLTDSVPLLSSDKVEVRRPPFLTLEGKGLRPLSCLSRIILTVDPVASPPEVASLYGKARAGLLKRRPRALSEKHMSLAAFASDYEKLSRAVMVDWNRSHPRSAYDRFTLFARDVRAATERLLHVSILDQ